MLTVEGGVDMDIRIETINFHVIIYFEAQVVDDYAESKSYGLLKKFCDICSEAYGFTVWSETSVTSIHLYAQKRMASCPSLDPISLSFSQRKLGSLPVWIRPLSIPLRYLTANGQASPFKWVELQPEFEKVVKTELYSYKKQPTKELQEAWYHLFGDAVASGVECVAPCMDPKSLNEVHNVDAEDDSTPNQYGGSKQPKKSAKIGGEQKDTQQRALKLLELDATVNQVGTSNVSSVISVITRMVNQGLMEKYDDLWCFKLNVLEDVVKRNFFLNFPEDEEEDMMFSVIDEHPYYIPHEELRDVHGIESNNEDLNEGSSNEMKQTRNAIATSIWNARRR
ncbi:hypothetical protein Tco_0385202 [Tanacetum coccineum]